MPRGSVTCCYLMANDLINDRMNTLYNNCTAQPFENRTNGRHLVFLCVGPVKGWAIAMSIAMIPSI